jgi:hypothetical protein
VTCDEAGRFGFDQVPPGLVQLLVHPPEFAAGASAEAAAARVVTPAFVL